MIVVVDSGVANLRSVSNALKYLHAEHRIAHVPADLDGADKLILPGVGAFAAGMAQLHQRGFVRPLCRQVEAGIPLLGICLGMQMLFDYSEEMGHCDGLGFLSGAVVRFPIDGPKVPHMGWNVLHHDESSPLLKNVPTGRYAYFVHSYYAQPTTPDMIIASTGYGVRVPAVVGKGNVFGAQFHPEKSQHTGLQLLKNFVEM